MKSRGTLSVHTHSWYTCLSVCLSVCVCVPILSRHQALNTRYGTFARGTGVKSRSRCSVGNCSTDLTLMHIRTSSISLAHTLVWIYTVVLSLSYIRSLYRDQLAYKTLNYTTYLSPLLFTLYTNSLNCHTNTYVNVYQQYIHIVALSISKYVCITLHIPTVIVNDDWNNLQKINIIILYMQLKFNIICYCKYMRTYLLI